MLDQYRHWVARQPVGMKLLCVTFPLLGLLDFLWSERNER